MPESLGEFIVRMLMESDLELQRFFQAVKISEFNREITSLINQPKQSQKVSIKTAAFLSGALELPLQKILNVDSVYHGEK